MSCSITTPLFSKHNEICIDIYESLDEIRIIREGEEYTWHPNGNRKTKLNWRNDKLHGRQIEWYPDGITMKADFNYDCGIMDGTQYAYYENGQPKFIHNIERRLHHKTQYEWYPDGTHKLESNLHYGTKHGKQIGTNPDKSKYEYNYDFDKLDGLQFEYYPDGSRKHEWMFNKGKKIEFQFAWYPPNEYASCDDNRKYIEFYNSNGYQHNLQRYWYPNGNPEANYNYKNGNKVGNQIGYYPSGLKKFNYNCESVIVIN